MKESLRINLLLSIFVLLFLLVLGRFFYWQVLLADQLAAAGERQHWTSFEIPAQRGEILARDRFPLVTNKEAFLLFASLPQLKKSPSEVATLLSPLLLEESLSSENREEKLEAIKRLLKERLSRQDRVWMPLKHKLSRQTKQLIEELKISGLGFEKEEKRSYPEGSSAAHLLGFVGQNANGKEKGYFGLEGYYDLELRGRPGMLWRERDALGRPILIGKKRKESSYQGHTLVTTIDRTIQFIVEKELLRGLKKYGASAGSVIVMEPQTGEILAMASFPNYHPGFYSRFDPRFYPNPNIALSYEPGSTFKILVMAAALNEGVVKPETRCSRCDGPRNIGGYTIRTWNEKYYPQSTMVKIIEHSDNVGMIFVAEKLGKEKLFDYLKKFGLGEKTGIDLQEEIAPPLRPKKEWRKIDLATASFGQGVAVTPIQMVRIAAVIANGGKLVRPFVVKEVLDAQGQQIRVTKPKVEREVISSTTAKIMTEMMVNAVERGEAKWCKPVGFRIAGKTGTAQIPVAGHYDEEKTIASFVGFAPADKPRFVMLVTLREPTSSPWGSETAAPLWFDIAKELFTYYGILPE